MCWGTWKKSRCLSKEDGLPVGAAMIRACAASDSVDKLLKERFDLLEGCENTRESGDSDSKDPRESLRIESALLILDVMDDIDSCETYKTPGESDPSPARIALSFCQSFCLCRLMYPYPTQRRTTAGTHLLV